jgi:uncharacterized protein (TIGR03790 family)
MIHRLFRATFQLVPVAAFLLAGPMASAIGPDNVALIVNRNSPASRTIVNHYRVKRLVPARNVIEVDWPADKRVATFEEFKSRIQEPVLAELTKRQISNEIAVWVTTPGLPHRVGNNSISSAIFFGSEQLPLDAKHFGPSAFANANEYFDRQNAFSPVSADGPRRYLHMLLDAGSTDATLAMIDRAVDADGTMPSGKVYLMDGEGPRSVRKTQYPTVAHLMGAMGADLDLRGGGKLRGVKDAIGMMTGVPQFPLKDLTFMPGAIADNLTSLGGVLDTKHQQTLCTEFLAAGAAASYGTVVEPYNYPSKFPSARVHLYYRTGFTAAESLWMSVAWPQHGLFVGDPLCRPYASGPKLSVESFQPGQRVKGKITIKALADATGEEAGVARLSAWVDDSSIGAAASREFPAGAKIELEIGERTFSYTTGSGERMASVILGLQKPLTEAGVMTAVSPGNLILLLPAGGLGRTRLAAKCSDPGVQVRALREAFREGTPTPIRAGWMLRSMSKPGDTLKLEIDEREKTVASIDLKLTEALDGQKLLEKVTSVMSPKLPLGYSFKSGLATAGANPPAQLTLEATEAKLAARPRARLVLTKASGSTMEITGRGDWSVLIDPTLRSYSIGWVRFTFGQPSLPLLAPLDTTTLSEGRHVLRVSGTRGDVTAPTSVLEIPFVVDNDPRGLVLSRVTESLAGGKIRVAKAAFTGGATGDLTWFVNGVRQPANPLESGLVIDPVALGPGRHEVSASGGELRSDNVVIVEIEK